MSQVEALFLRTLQDLAARIADSDDYTILGASALIRKLLIDDSPLVDQVNRQHRQKIRFEISVVEPFLPGVPPPTMWSVQDGLDPETSFPDKPRKDASREQLLSTVLAIIEGKSYSLREIVLFEANVMGGVHAGTAKEEKERILEAVGSTFGIGGHRGSLRQLQAVGRIVLRGLDPLRAAIEAAHDA